MSVLKPKRKQSSIEYIRLANEIFSHSLNLSSRLSARYGRILQPNIMNAASKLLSECIEADSTFPSCLEYAKMRETHLINAIGALNVLDVMMAHTYEILMLNPQGAFTKSMSETEAVERLDKMCEETGKLINVELAALKAVRRKTHDKFKELEHSEQKTEELEGQMKISEFEYELTI